jgi:hypothetical protein
MKRPFHLNLVPTVYFVGCEDVWMTATDKLQDDLGLFIFKHLWPLLTPKIIPIQIMSILNPSTVLHKLAYCKHSCPHHISNSTYVNVLSWQLYPPNFFKGDF